MALGKYEVTELWVVQVKDAGWSPDPDGAWNTVVNGPWKTADAARSWATSGDGGFQPDDEGRGWRSVKLTGPGWKDVEATPFTRVAPGDAPKGGT